MDVFLYLRKSRKEEREDTLEETLSKHRTLLIEYAKTHDLHIIEEFKEVVSGDSLYSRPEMLRLLEAVDSGIAEGVLCVDIDRLGRGGMHDQGLILDTFKRNNVLIITPAHTYDLNDEADETITEMQTFIGRQELKKIKTRLKRGEMESIKAGCYMANAPYGYRNIRVGKKPTLEIVEEEAYFVRMIFKMYLDGCGCTTIANTLNALGAKPHRASAFGRTSVMHILKNPTFCGKIAWFKKQHHRKGTHGNTKHKIVYNPPEKWLVLPGIHPAIIDEQTFDRVQEIIRGRYIPPSNKGIVENPLCSLVFCANCGGHMQRQGSNKGVPYLLCQKPGCVSGAKVEYVESAILSYLSETLRELLLPTDAKHTSEAIQKYDEVLAVTDRELQKLETQRSRLYDFLEDGTYDPETFKTRMALLNEKKEALTTQQADLLSARRKASGEDRKELARRIQNVLDTYHSSNAAGRNMLLKSVIDRILYSKKKKTAPDDFQLVIKLRSF